MLSSVSRGGGRKIADAKWQELNEIGADPFILYAVEDAHKCLQKGTSDGYDLIPILSHFITRPLQIHLNKPTSAIIILEQLEVIELRFKRHINGDWKGPLDTYTGYMDDFQKLGSYGFAEYVTQTEHTLYMKLSINSFRKYEGTTEEKRALRNLNYHSNEVAYLVSDSLKCRILSEDQWLRCATVSTVVPLTPNFPIDPFLKATPYSSQLFWFLRCENRYHGK